MTQAKLKEAWNLQQQQQQQQLQQQSLSASSSQRRIPGQSDVGWRPGGRGRGRGLAVTSQLQEDDGTDLDAVFVRHKLGRGRGIFGKMRQADDRTLTSNTIEPASVAAVTSLTVGSGVRVRLEAVPEGIANSVQTFYVCRGCGRVYWHGSHMPRALQQFEHVIT